MKNLKNFFYDKIKGKYSLRRIYGVGLISIGLLLALITFTFVIFNALNVTELSNLSRCLDCLQFIIVTLISSGVGLTGSTTADSFVRKK